MIKCVLFMILVGMMVIFSPAAHAYTTPTHSYTIESISKTEIQNFSLNAYLLNNFKFNNGVETKIKSSGKSRNVFEWIAIGGVMEDDAYAWVGALNTRPSNHFHNPLKSLDEAGFSGIWGLGFVDGESALLWAQKEIGTQSIFQQNYSWRDARDYLYKALTATSDVAREKNFADTFRAVGQVMHLIQDMSIPDHTRNDGHYRVARTLETWTNEALDQKIHPEKNAILSAALNNPKPFPLSELSQPSPFGDAAPMPIAQLFDSRQYYGGNPNVTTAPNIGLSEYTNANFLSGDTLLTVGLFNTSFPYPSLETSVRIDFRTIADPLDPYATVDRLYFVKVADGERGPNGNGYLLAGVDYLREYRSAYELENMDISFVPELDDYVFADYAKLLLPRAVGYSATLLHYFFRGQLETTALEQKDSSGNVTALQLHVTNKTPGETMNNGWFTLAYRYKPAGSSNYEYRTTADLPAGVLPPDGGRQLTIPLKVLVGGETVYDSPVPADATDRQYTLVYHGPLGSEPVGVIGQVLTVIPDAIAITPPERFVYALADDGRPEKSFSTMRMKLRDNDPQVVMTGGSVVATLRYKTHLTHRDDLSNEPPDGWERSADFQSISAPPVTVDLDETTPKEIVCDFSATPLPFGITDLSLIVEYRKDAQILAHGSRNLNEPQYVGVWNAHDRVLIDFDLNPDDSVHDWRLLSENEILADAALLKRLDTDGGGLIDAIIDPVTIDVDVALTGVPEEVAAENYQAAFRSLPPGRFGRLVFIADTSPVFALFRDRHTSRYPDSSAPGDYLHYDEISRYFFPGAVNQQVGDSYYYTPLSLFRGGNNHFSYISTGLYPKVLLRTEAGQTIKAAPWPAPASTAPVAVESLNP